MKAYHDNLRNIMATGHEHEDRTGLGRRSIFGTLDRYNLSDGTLPLVTTRKIFTRGLIRELIWFISGSHDASELEADNVNIWKPWTVNDESIAKYAEKYSEGDKDLEQGLIRYWTGKHKGSIGPMYGAMWRNAPRESINRSWPVKNLADLPSDKLKKWRSEYDEIKAAAKDEIVEFEKFASLRYYEAVDQLNELVVNLKKRPFSSRHVVTAWVPSMVPFEELAPEENVLLGRGCLAACHAMFQCFVYPPEKEGGKNRLSLKMMIRSQDACVGEPYNIAQYSILLAMLAHVTDMEPYDYIHDVGDHHVYLPHKEKVLEQLTREPLPAPKLWLNPEVKDLFAFTMDDIRIEGYECHPEIKYEIAK